MPKTLTSLNPKHPHTRLVSFKQALKENYRKLTTAELDQLVNAEFAKRDQAFADAHAHPQHRHEKLEFLFARGVEEFKQRWEAEYGWPFDDTYNSAKLHQHMAQMQLEAQERSYIETHMRCEEKVAELSKLELTPQVDAELKEWQLALNASPFERQGDKLVRKLAATPEPFDTTKITDQAGRFYTKEEFDALPEEQQKSIRAFASSKISALIGSGFAGVMPGGGIVDRRLVPTAIPCQQNRILGTPAPRALPSELAAGVVEQVVETRPDTAETRAEDAKAEQELAAELAQSQEEPKRKPCEYCGTTELGVCAWPEKDVWPCRTKEDLEAQKGALGKKALDAVTEYTDHLKKT